MFNFFLTLYYKCLPLPVPWLPSSVPVRCAPTRARSVRPVWPCAACSAAPSHARPVPTRAPSAAPAVCQATAPSWLPSAQCSASCSRSARPARTRVPSAAPAGCQAWSIKFLG
ncbi:hypothetical protein AR679_gp227 [Yellowstone lake phycodnavirus 1]|uniref:hypothetical protein n=1 Tax=Yellowstone lake phycodnavirus 1 TaxID=1586713 RepID=UPI0006EBD8B6|nr:hypothetical protein AR679_gp227 [Yellowstone lake phycodnavirus 1]BAT22253.1 hypothetical protein [Yellowstone lake phycodnavirus 1]